MAMTSKQKIYMGAGVGLMALLALLGFAGEAKADEVPEPTPDDETNAQDVLDALLADTPTPGKFYKIVQGDNLTKIVRAALDKAVPGRGSGGDDSQTRVRYMKCVSGGGWNRGLYGIQGDFTDGFPGYTSPDSMSIRSAFFPDHDNAISAILNKKMPDRGDLRRSGAGYSGGRGNSYGLLWLPAVNKETLAEFQEPQCEQQKWPDDTSAMEPPAMLFKLFEGG